MLNPISSYAEAGQKAGLARRQKDQGRVSHWSGWMHRAIALENPEDRVQARAAFDEAYRLECEPSPKLG